MTWLKENAAFCFAMASMVLVLGLIFIGFIQEVREKQHDCANRGGQLVDTGRYGDDMCVKDGVIVKVY